MEWWTFIAETVMSPNEELARRTVAALVDAGLVPEADGEAVRVALAGGSLRQRDWEAMILGDGDTPAAGSIATERPRA